MRVRSTGKPEALPDGAFFLSGVLFFAGSDLGLSGLGLVGFDVTGLVR